MLQNINFVVLLIYTFFILWAFVSRSTDVFILIYFLLTLVWTFLAKIRRCRSHGNCWCDVTTCCNCEYDVTDFLMATHTYSCVQVWKCNGPWYWKIEKKWQKVSLIIRRRQILMLFFHFCYVNSNRTVEPIKRQIVFYVIRSQDNIGPK